MSLIQPAHNITILYYFLANAKCSRIGRMFSRYATRKALPVHYIREIFCFPDATPKHTSLHCSRVNYPPTFHMSSLNIRQYVVQMILNLSIIS